LVGGFSAKYREQTRQDEAGSNEARQNENR
jgi:hypothetical protein